MHDRSTPERDPVRELVGEACLRLMAGVIPPRTVAALRASVRASPEGFPWQEINEQIVALPVEGERLLQAGVRAQRDWILLGGRARPVPSLKQRSKGVAAYLLSRAIFFALYSAAVVVLLILLKHRWPGLDIYLALDWLGDAFPALFRRG